jgi:acid phosphatase family membrane protein YuiD
MTMNTLQALWSNHVLLSALLGWALAQILKLPVGYLINKRWDWALLVSAGGMPSSHSALVIGATHAVGLHVGFDSPLFALGFAISMIVIYDAANVRRQAGMQAQKINVLVSELLSGHPISEKELREVLGHTWLEVGGGVLLAILVAQLCWMLWG